VDTTDERRTELIRRSRFFDDRDAPLIRSHVFDNAREDIVFSPRMLNIHRDIINEVGSDECLEDLWVSPVGIKFYLESESLDLGTELSEISVDCGFSSADRDSLEKSLSCFEEFEKIFLALTGDLESRYALGENEVRVVTVSAPKIASKCKYHTRNMSRIVYK